MNVQRVPIAELPSFLERFSRGHHGWLTHVEVEDETHRGEIDEGAQPLGGIVADRDRNRVLVFLDRSPRGSIRYGIDQPTGLWRETSEGGVRLELDSADGSTTTLECHPAAH
ncbi:MAG TPA: hypothetical protein VF958_09225 [Thermoanaerobaculia bacterium]